MLRQKLSLPFCLLACVLSLFLCPLATHGQATLADRQEMSRLFQLGNTAYQKFDYVTAYQHWQTALDRAIALKDEYSIAAFADAAGNALKELKEFAKAIEYMENALLLRERGGAKPSDIINSLNNIGLTYKAWRKPDKALSYLERAVTAAEAAGDIEAYAHQLTSYATQLDEMGRLDQAVRHYQTALKIRQNQKNLDGIAGIYNNLGLVAQKKGDLTQAMQYLTQASRDFGTINNLNGQAAALNNLGNLYLDLDDYRNALQCLTRCVKLKEALGNPALLETSLGNLGNAYITAGLYTKALTQYQRALDLAQKTRAVERVPVALNQIGDTYRSLGQYSKAAEYHEQALRISRENKDVEQISHSLYSLGMAAQGRGELKSALVYFLQCLPNDEKSADPTRLSSTLDNLGSVYGMAEQHEKSLEYYLRAYELRVKSRKRNLIAKSLHNLGVAAMMSGKQTEAVDYFTSALRIKRTLGSRDDIAITSNNLGLLYMEMGKLDRAQEAFAESVENREAVSAEIGSAENLGAFQQNIERGIYPLYALLKVKQNKPEEALLLMERGRGRALARQASLNKKDFSRLLSRESAAQWRQALDAYKSAGQAWKSVADAESLIDAAQSDAISRSLMDARKRYHDAEARLNQLRTTLSAASPAFAQAQSATPPKMEELTALAKQNPDTLFLQWGVAGSKTLLLFALSEKDGLKAFAIASDNSALNKKVQEWREAIQNTDSGETREAELAKSIYTVLFGEVEKAGLLASGRYGRLVLVPHGMLLDLPFAGLMNAQGKRLIENYPLSVSISLGTLLWTEESKKTERTLLCIADPTGGAENGKDIGRYRSSALPAARVEGKAIAALIPDNLLLVGTKATRSAIQPNLAKCQILHFATHGLLDADNGLRSGLALASETEDEFGIPIIEAREIAEMTLNAQLATLSACDTAQGQKSGGDGLFGLAWAFRAAGCPSIVASQWSVDDAATGKLMVAFYRALLVGKRKDEALREAMLAVKGEFTSAKPFFWSAFQVIGNTNAMKFH